jgi:hypothetical protein
MTLINGTIISDLTKNYITIRKNLEKVCDLLDPKVSRSYEGGTAEEKETGKKIEAYIKKCQEIRKTVLKLSDEFNEDAALITNLIITDIIKSK